MLNAFVLAVRQLPEPEMRRPLVLTLLWSVALFALLWLGCAWTLVHLAAGHAWVAWLAGLLGVLAAPVVTYLLFPAVALTILGLFAETIVVAVETRYYPFLPAPSATRWLDILRSGLRLALFSIVFNLLALPFYLLAPGVNLVLFFLLNGYLIGREYFDLVALRRMDDRAARRLWRDHRGLFVVGGAVVAGLFLLPVVNLLAPLVGIAAAVHLVERLKAPEMSHNFRS